MLPLGADFLDARRLSYIDLWKEGSVGENTMGRIRKTLYRELALGPEQYLVSLLEQIYPE